MRTAQITACLLGGIFILTSGLSANVWAIDLQTLLADMHDSSGTRTRQYEEQRIHDQLQLRQEDTGWRLFGGSDYGHYRELEQTGRQTYDGFGAQIGLRYPLLGTLQSHRAAVIETDISLTQSRYLTSIARAEQRQALRQVYVDWWRTQVRSEWCATYSRLGAAEQKKIRLRAEKENLRLSEQLWLQQRWTTLLRPCDGLDRLFARQRQHLDYLYGSTIPASAIPRAATLPSALAASQDWRPLIDSHPVMKMHQAEEQGLRPLLESRWTDRVEASFSISQRYDNRSDIHGSGGGTVAAITFEVPLGSIANGYRASPAQAQYLAARERALDAGHSLMLSLEQALEQYHRLIGNLEERRQRLAHTSQLIKEQVARNSFDAEEGFTTLRLAVLDNAALEFELIDDWHAAWLIYTQLETMAEAHIPAHAGSLLRWSNPHQISSGAPVLSSRRPAAHGWSTAVYVWDSTPMLDPSKREQQVRALAQAGFNHIYLGFDSNQVAELEHLKPRITELLGQLKKQGFRTDLLLGDPNWLLPAYRKDMIRLIDQFAGLPFDRLHLDLEVEQLGWPVETSHLQGWLQTLKAATRSSPWPVTIVSHHRWFAPTERMAETCIPCKLPALGIQDVTLMLYSTALPSTITRTRQIIEGWPDLKLHLAQSIEINLSDEESWSGASALELQNLNFRLQNELQRDGLAGIAWQDWSNFQRSTAAETQHR